MLRDCKGYIEKFSFFVFSFRLSFFFTCSIYHNISVNPHKTIDLEGYPLIKVFYPQLSPDWGLFTSSRLWN